MQRQAVHDSRLIVHAKHAGKFLAVHDSVRVVGYQLVGDALARTRRLASSQSKGAFRLVRKAAPTPGLAAPAAINAWAFAGSSSACATANAPSRSYPCGVTV